MKVLLLAPKGARAKGTLPDYRSELATSLQECGHDPVILEQEPDRRGETLRSKFLRLAAKCDQAILVWPAKATMATTADEIVLLQEAYDPRPLDVVRRLHEAEIEVRAHELRVHAPSDQSGYLDGILACKPSSYTGHAEHGSAPSSDTTPTHSCSLREITNRSSRRLRSASARLSSIVGRRG